jgi:transposase
LTELCRQKLDADPFSGYLFVFRSRRATYIKVLVYDGQGFWLAIKRLSKGRFRWWPQITGAEEPARVLLAAGNPDIGVAQSELITRSDRAVRSLFTCVLKRFLAHGG